MVFLHVFVAEQQKPAVHSFVFELCVQNMPPVVP